MYQLDFTKPAHIYFIGIGGISMSGLAEILKDAGFEVSGSDRQESALTEHLVSRGIGVTIGQREENIVGDIDCVVYTAAIHEDNPEFARSRQLGIPMLSRAQLLGQIMKNYQLPIAVSGTHGKTTTTSMISEMMMAAGVDPTISVGGMLPSIGGNIRVGGRQYFITEACEYTNSFLEFFPKMALILNVEADHLDFFKDLEDIRHSFRRFADLLPAEGCLIINGEIPHVEELTEGLPCRVLTFGRREQMASVPDYYPEEITYRDGRAVFTAQTPQGPCHVELSVPGEHNVLNALAALAAADEAGISREKSLPALCKFSGTDRRFEQKGMVGGVRIIDDYAHHPTEIRATLKAAERMKGEGTLWVVFQPHTYTRTKALLPEFAQALQLADHVVLADIYAAREQDIYGVSSRTLQEEIQKLGTVCDYFPSFDEIETFLLENCIKGDLLITMGAGDVYKIGDGLLGNA